jgi:predicted lipoprotein with Yx(FWY)xxD motif
MRQIYANRANYRRARFRNFVSTPHQRHQSVTLVLTSIRNPYRKEDDMHMLKLVSTSALLLAFAGPALAQDSYGSDESADSEMSGDAMDNGMESVVMTGQAGDEVFLMDSNKMTLYTFDNDSEGMSTCYDSCAENWPPLTAPEGTDLPLRTAVQKSATVAAG